MEPLDHYRALPCPACNPHGADACGTASAAAAAAQRSTLGSVQVHAGVQGQQDDDAGGQASGGYVIFDTQPVRTPAGQYAACYMHDYVHTLIAFRLCVCSFCVGLVSCLVG